METKCLIIGFGESGKWAYNLSVGLGYVPFIYDDNFLSLSLIENYVKSFSFACISPGVNMAHPIIKLLRDEKVPIISEIELAYLARTSKNRIIAVTGTNGKTTVTMMIGSVLGIRAMVAGNIGVPWSKVCNTQKEVTVLELSSFQLNNIQSFTPNIAIFTNIAPDHIDYHGSYRNYIDAKLNLIKNADGDTIVIYWGEDKELKREILSRNLRKTYYFATRKLSGNGIFINGEEDVVINNNGKLINLFSVNEFGEIAQHNKLNLIASSLACWLLGEDKENIFKSLKNFKYAPFRQEKVENKLGLTIINDSKATNLGATLSAIKSNSQNVTLLVGGRGKSEDYSNLFESEFRPREIVAYGECADEFVRCAFKYSYKNITKIKDFKDAVKKAVKSTPKNGTLLFSPACSSFDQFASYSERGKEFNKIIRELEARV